MWFGITSCNKWWGCCCLQCFWVMPSKVNESRTRKSLKAAKSNYTWTIVTVYPCGLRNTAVHNQYFMKNKWYLLRLWLAHTVHASVEVSRWGDNSFSHLILHSFTSTVLNAGIAKYWLSGQRCMDARVLLVWFQSWVWIVRIKSFSGAVKETKELPSWWCF